MQNDKYIIIKPMIGEKATRFIESQRKYVFEVNTKANFKNILIAVGYGHAPAIFRFFAVLPELLIPIILITQIWILLSIAIGIKETLNFRSNFKSIGVVVIVFVIIILAFIFIMGKSKLIPIS